MDKSEKTSSDSKKVSARGTALVIFGTIADTTWRLFVPVIGLLILGLWLDSKTDNDKPWFGLLGVLLGCATAFLLVRLQYRQVTGDNK